MSHSLLSREWRASIKARAVQRYHHHPEPKSTDSSGGEPQQAVGLLARRPVWELERNHIGKEANQIDEQAARLEHDPDEVLNDYGSGFRTDAFSLHVGPLLKLMKASVLAKGLGVSERWIKAIRNGRAIPSGEMRNILTRLASDMHERYPPSERALDRGPERKCALASYVASEPEV